jgi:hypothetical protein
MCLKSVLIFCPTEQTRDVLVYYWKEPYIVKRHRLVRVEAQARWRFFVDSGFDPGRERGDEPKIDTTLAAASIPHSLTPINSH